MASKFSVKPAEVTRWSILPCSAVISPAVSLTESGLATSQKCEVTRGFLKKLQLVSSIGRLKLTPQRRDFLS